MRTRSIRHHYLIEEPLERRFRPTVGAPETTFGGPGGRLPLLSRRSLIVGLACALLLAVSASPSLAQGTIYYRYQANNGQDVTLRAVNADGSSDRLVFDAFVTSPVDGQKHSGSPTCSHASQNGALVWLEVLDDNQYNGTGPNYGYGTLYQVTVGANGATSLVRLSNFDINTRGVGLVAGAGVVWAFDDSFISFVVADFTGTTPLLKIVRYPVANLVTNGGVLINETDVQTVLVWPNMNSGYGHSWSPDGTLLAYQNVYTAANGTNYSQLILRNVATGAEQVVVDQGVSGIGVGAIEYAPDGTRIAFDGNNSSSVYTISVQGGAPWVVAAASTAKNGVTTQYGHPVWSPDSGGLAIQMRKTNTWQSTNEYVAKVPSTGGTVTNLTPKNTYYKAPRAWR
jgi:hypothetical protein